MRPSGKSTKKIRSQKPRSSGRGKWMVVANMARFLSVSISDLVLKVTMLDQVIPFYLFLFLFIIMLTHLFFWILLTIDSILSLGKGLGSIFFHGLWTYRATARPMDIGIITVVAKSYILDLVNFITGKLAYTLIFEHGCEFCAFFLRPVMPVCFAVSEFILPSDAFPMKNFIAEEMISRVWLCFALDFHNGAFPMKNCLLKERFLLPKWNLCETRT